MTDGLGLGLPPLVSDFSVFKNAGVWQARMENGSAPWPKWIAQFRRPTDGNVWTNCANGVGVSNSGDLRTNPYGLHVGTLLQVRMVWCKADDTYESVPSPWIEITES